MSTFDGYMPKSGGRQLASDTISGAFPVLPAIFNRQGAIDERGFVATIEFALACGVDGVVFPGLASEYDQLSIDERLHLIALVGRTVGDRAAFIVGASDGDLGASEALARAGAAAGAVAAMVLTPKALDGNLPAIPDFFAALGRDTGVTVMLQNAPRPMGLGLSPEEVAGIAARAPAVRWLKEETQPCGQQISALLAAMPPHVAGVFGGAGGRYIIDELSRGAVGTMPAVELADIHAALIARWRGGDMEHARDLYERMLPLLTIQAVYRWHLTKTVLKLRGVIADAHVRAPGPRLDTHDEQEVKALLARISDLLAVAPVGCPEPVWENAR